MALLPSSACRLCLLACFLRRLASFFQPAADREPPSPFFTPEEIGRLHRAGMDPKTALDDQTWHDLLLEAWEERLAQDTSIFGRQLLHRRLRAGLQDADCAALSGRLRGLLDDPARIDALTGALRPLRFAETEAAGLLFGGPGYDMPQPPW